MDDDRTSWREFLGGENRLKVVVFAGGVALTAIEVYIGSTLMPSVVEDIGGVDLFAWVTTVFIVASIAASMFAAVRPFGLGPRQNYLIAAAAFGFGSLLCGVAPSMPVLLVGRAMQGFGGGLLGALTYMMVRLVFPERLWAQAIALISGMWAIATLVGPAIGGVFAEFGAWRWAFFVILPAAALLAVGALRVVPERSSEVGMSAVPALQIGLMIAAVLALSVASAVAETDSTPALVLAAMALLAIIALGLAERHARQKLLPTGTFAFGSHLAAMFGLMVLLQISIISDIFVPLFVQRLHGVGPLVAGYIVALLAVGWSSSSMLTSTWSERRARLLIASGPLLLIAGAIGLALCMGRDNPHADLTMLVPIGLSLLVMGVGIGVAWTHLTPRVMQVAPPGEHDVTSAALNTISLAATGMGAAAAGLVVNLAGLSGSAAPVLPANWLYGLWVLVPVAAAPIAWRIVQRGRRTQAVALPAE
jgi:MFS family permease